MKQHLTRRRLLIAGVPLLLVLAAVSRAEAEAVYLFFLRKDLSLALDERPDEVLGKKVVVTDQLTVVWPDAQERPNRLRNQRYILFDTEHFRCAVPADRAGTHLQSIWEDARRGYGPVSKEIEEINRQQRQGTLSLAQARDAMRDKYWELYRIWSNQPIVTIFGTVERADFWGEVRGQSHGVATEVVTIVADRVERPRQRWYDTLDK